MAEKVFSSGWADIKLTATETIDISNNSSTLAFSMHVKQARYVIPYVFDAYPDGAINVNGALLTNGETGCTTKTFNSVYGSHVADIGGGGTFYRVKQSSTSSAATWTTTVAHADNGTGTANVSFDITVAPASHVLLPLDAVRFTGTWSISLTRIVRPSSLTISGKTEIGQTLTAKLGKTLSSDKNTLSWRLNSEDPSAYNNSIIGTANTTDQSIEWDTNVSATKERLLGGVSNGVANVVFRLVTKNSAGTQTAAATYTRVSLAVPKAPPSTITSTGVTATTRIGDSVTITIHSDDPTYTHKLEWRLKSGDTSYHTIATEATLSAGVTSVTWNTGGSAHKSALEAGLSNGKVSVLLKLTTNQLSDEGTNYTTASATLLEVEPEPEPEPTVVLSTFESIKSADHQYLYVGDKVDFTINPGNPAYSHNIMWSVDGSDYDLIGSTPTMAAGATTFQWTPTTTNNNKIYNACPNKTSHVVTFRLTTLYNGSAVGERDLATRTYHVGASVKPSFTLENPVPGGALANTDFSTLFVAGLSTAVVGFSGVSGGSGATVSTITVTGYGSSGESRTITYNPGTPPTSITTPVITTAKTSLELAVTMTDSRGRSTKNTKTISVVSYSPPTLTFTKEPFRCSSYSNPSPTGTRIGLKATATVSDIPGNSLEVLQYRTLVASSGSQFKTWANFSSATNTITPSTDTYTATTAYTVQVRYRDLVQKALNGSSFYNRLSFDIPTSAVPFNLHPPGDGAAFGEYASSGYVSIASALSLYLKGGAKGTDWTAATASKADLLAAFKTPTLVAFTVSATEDVPYSDYTVSGVTTDSRVIVQRRTSTTATTLQEPYPVECAVISNDTLRIFWNATPASTGNVAIVAYIVY